MFLRDVPLRHKSKLIVVRGCEGRLLPPRPLGGTIGGNKGKSDSSPFQWSVNLFTHVNTNSQAKPEAGSRVPIASMSKFGLTLTKHFVYLR